MADAIDSNGLQTNATQGAFMTTPKLAEQAISSFYEGSVMLPFMEEDLRFLNAMGNEGVYTKVGPSALAEQGEGTITPITPKTLESTRFTFKKYTYAHQLTDEWTTDYMPYIQQTAAVDFGGALAENVDNTVISTILTDLDVLDSQIKYPNGKTGLNIVATDIFDLNFLRQLLTDSQKNGIGYFIKAAILTADSIESLERSARIEGTAGNALITREHFEALKSSPIADMYQFTMRGVRFFSSNLIQTALEGSGAALGSGTVQVTAGTAGATYEIQIGDETTGAVAFDTDINTTAAAIEAAVDANLSGYTATVTTDTVTITAVAVGTIGNAAVEAILTQDAAVTKTDITGGTAGAVTVDKNILIGARGQTTLGAKSPMVYAPKWNPQWTMGREELRGDYETMYARTRYGVGVIEPKGLYIATTTKV